MKDRFRIGLITLFSLYFLSCEDLEPPPLENFPEIVTRVTLTFTPLLPGETIVIVSAVDPDNIGPLPVKPESPIRLEASVEYILEISVINELANDDEMDISAEIREEDFEHMFFFGWTDNYFMSPSGNGNIDERTGTVNYSPDDNDINDLPVGLSGSSWTPNPGAINGTFRIKLQHVPTLNDGTLQKTTTSTSDDGDTDLDITFDLELNN